MAKPKLIQIKREIVSHETWQKSMHYCPFCGQQALWYESNSSDATHKLCVGCKAEFEMKLVDIIGNSTKSVIEQILTKSG